VNETDALLDWLDDYTEEMAAQAAKVKG